MRHTGNRRVRIGIVGTRFAAHRHLENYALAHRVEVSNAGISSPTTERSARSSAKFGRLPAYEGIDNLLGNE